MTGLEVAALITAVAAIVMNLLALRNLKILRANRRNYQTKHVNY